MTTDDQPEPNLGTDRLNDQMEYTRQQFSEEAKQEAYDRTLHQIHCLLLERATGGRLTFVGDEIVRKI